MAVIKPQITLRLDLETHAKLKKIAGRECRSMTNLIEYWLKKQIADYERANGEIPVSDDDLYLSLRMDTYANRNLKTTVKHGLYGRQAA